MKIALLGYGRMGQAIEQIAIKRGHDIVIKTNEATGYSIKDADVAIDFSIPDAAFGNISNCLNNKVPVISGTTGWLDQYNDAISLCEKNNGAFIYASNFSLGVNIFFELNEMLAKMMTTLEDYKVDVEEIHHTKKLDAPSGTAITLAEGILKNHSKYNNWKLDQSGELTLPITAKRIPDVPGTHTITYKSDIDTIKIEHEAHSRQGFALGAVIAAELIIGKTGVFTMKDVLSI